MGREDHFEVLKLKTYILKVNIHCDGCKMKVKKLLHGIQGVFSVDIDVENQKVTVQANLDPAALIKKLIRAGKHAELWSQKSSNQNNNINNHGHPKQQKQATTPAKGGNSKNKEQGKQAPKPFKAQHKRLPSSTSSDEEDSSSDDSDEDVEDDLPLLDKFKQIDFLRQANNAATGAKKNANSGISASGGGGGGGKRTGGNPNQNHMKHPHPNVAAFQKMVNPNAGDGRKMGDINGVAGLGLSGFAANNGGSMVMNMPGYRAHPSSMMSNLGPRGQNMQQPQMMFLRSPQISPYTGYYSSYPSPYCQINPSYNNDVTHLFSDENTRGCVVM